MWTQCVMVWKLVSCAGGIWKGPEPSVTWREPRCTTCPTVPAKDSLPSIWNKWSLFRTWTTTRNSLVGINRNILIMMAWFLFFSPLNLFCMFWNYRISGCNVNNTDVKVSSNSGFKYFCLELWFFNCSTTFTLQAGPPWHTLESTKH